MKVWVKGLNALTGGATGALDAINGNLLTHGDIAIVRASGVAYLYELDHDNSTAETSPVIIQPDKNYGTKRWVLQGLNGPSVYSTQIVNASMSAYVASDISLSAAPAWYEVGSGAESYTSEWDTGSNFSVSTGRYTIPVSGSYLIQAITHIGVLDGSQSLVAAYVGVCLNGSLARQADGFYSSASWNVSLTSAVIISAAASQTFSLAVYGAVVASQPKLQANYTRLTISLLNT